MNDLIEAIDAAREQWYAAVDAAKPCFDRATELAEKQLEELREVFKPFTGL